MVIQVTCVSVRSDLSDVGKVEIIEITGRGIMNTKQSDKWIKATERKGEMKGSHLQQTKINLTKSEKYNTSIEVNNARV